MIERFSFTSFIAGIIVGVLVVGAWLFGTDSTLMPVSLTQTPVATANATTSESVAVSDQSAGSSVLIDSVTVPPPGVWIAIRETDGDNLGNVLGAVRVGVPRMNVSVPLLRNTDPGQTYAVELYRDDNNGAFDPDINSVYVDFTTDARVVVYFKTTQ